ncbi:EamA family transporter [Clostridium niameyense]|uniref:EamA family transporter n=1 Tax=Clostridium niameyense TaxID=1622073 RepID=A0A6M0R8A3_9CLOT|nr:DMT family transporter [Clostridium niameyense]NEZ46471.1 EamA family transporter [Clostridium niameyense]
MEKLKNNKTKGFILVIIAALFWGYMGVPTKNLGDLNFDAFSVSFFRTFMAGIFYFLYCLKKDLNLLKVDKKGLLFFIIYGIIAFGGTFICYNLSVNYISIALATMFMFTSQVWVVILSYFIFKEKFTPKKIIAIVLTLIGCFMMCKIYDTQNISLNPKGVIFGLISGFTFALQIILAKINSSKYNQNTLLAYSFIFASLSLIPFMNFKNTIHIFQTSNNISFIIKNIIIIGFFNTVIANGAYINSVKYIEVGIASIIASSEIVLASIIAYIVFHQTLDCIQIIGMTLIILSIILLQIKDKKQTTN